MKSLAEYVIERSILDGDLEAVLDYGDRRMDIIQKINALTASEESYINFIENVLGKYKKNRRRRISIEDRMGIPNRDGVIDGYRISGKTFTLKDFDPTKKYLFITYLDRIYEMSALVPKDEKQDMYSWERSGVYLSKYCFKDNWREKKIEFVLSPSSKYSKNGLGEWLRDALHENNNNRFLCYEVPKELEWLYDYIVNDGVIK